MKFLEQLIYFLRDEIWKYPQAIFSNQNSILHRFQKYYLKVRPFSHIVLALTVLSIPVGYFGSDLTRIVRAGNEELIEGVLVGTDSAGNLLTLQKLNPLVLSNIQIEKDVDELIYESLITLNSDGTYEKVLVETIAANEEGDNYRIKLREDVYWHDGQKFSAKDVEATFNLLQNLDDNAATKTIYSTAAKNKIDFIPIEGDDYRFEFQLKGVVPNILELISFKIMPAHLISELNNKNILTSTPKINNTPIGTGKYKLADAGENFLTLKINKEYYESSRYPSIQKIKFQFFTTEESLVDALLGGQIHAASSLTSDSLSKLRRYANIRSYKTDVIYNQYYAMYFNLSENGPEIFKDMNIRRAISAAINREFIVEILQGDAKEANGPIAENSFAYDSNIERYTYNKERAIKILEDNGWKVGSDGVRQKDNKKLEFTLYAIDNLDRNKVTDSIVDDLKQVGIEVKLVRKPNGDLINDNILNRDFDTLLYSMTTFIDPDRYELFHSSQIAHPGLNISSYKSKEETIDIVEGEDKNVKQRRPEVDVRLEKARSFYDEKQRADEYSEFQRIVASEAPVVFLYHPIMNYSVNTRVRNVDLTNVYTQEGRFRHIDKWTIEL